MTDHRPARSGNTPFDRSWYCYLQDHYGRAVDLVAQLPCFLGRCSAEVSARLAGGDQDLHRVLGAELASASRRNDQRSLGAGINLIVVLFFTNGVGRRAVTRHEVLGDELEDALLDAQTRLVTDFERYDPERGSLIAWYSRLFHRACLDLRRKYARQLSALRQHARELAPALEEASDAAVEARELDSTLRGAVARVARRKSARQKRLLLEAHPVMWGRAQLPRGSTSRCARRSGFSATTVRTLLHRLRKDVGLELVRSSAPLVEALVA